MISVYSQKETENTGQIIYLDSIVPSPSHIKDSEIATFEIMQTQYTYVSQIFYHIRARFSSLIPNRQR